MEPANHTGNASGGAVKSEALFREHGKQVAALCWRTGRRGLEVLLITSLNSKRWILPKGWPEADLTRCENAAREAFEEAGVTGKIAVQPVGHYHYLKEKREGGGIPVSVDVFALCVTRQVDDWPEKGRAHPGLDAAERGDRESLRTRCPAVLKNFRKQHAAHRPVVAARRRG